MKNLKLVLLILVVTVFLITPLYAAPEQITFYPATSQDPNKPKSTALSIDSLARSPIGLPSLNSATTGPMIAADDPYDQFEPKTTWQPPKEYHIILQ